MKRTLILVEKHADGSAIRHVLEESFVFKGDVHAAYTLIDAQTGEQVNGLELHHKGNNLELLLDKKVVATITDDASVNANAETEGQVTDNAVAEGGVISNDSHIISGDSGDDGHTGASAGDGGDALTVFGALGIAGGVLAAGYNIHKSAFNSDDQQVFLDLHVDAPGFALNSDTGADSGDGVTNDVTVNVTGLANDLDFWEYSLDGGSTWNPGTGTSFDLAANTTYAEADILVVQVDTRGNVSDIVGNASVIITDTTAPTVTFSDASYDTATDTLTLTGSNVDTLLTGTESSSNDITANLDWTKLQWDVDSDNTGNITFSQNDISSVHVTDANTLTIVLDSTKAAALEGTSGFDNLTGNDSVEVTAGFTGDTAGNVATTDAFDGPSHVDTSIVVFDLIDGISSSHSSRTFDVSTSYTIYIMVDSNSASMTAVPQWGSGENLGSDDTIILVGSGSSILGYNSGSVTAAGQYSTSAHWYTSVGLAAQVYQSGHFSRSAPVSSSSAVTLWSGTGNWPASGPSQIGYLVTIPAGVMTSQGLA